MVLIYNSKIQNYCVWPSAAEQVQEMPSTHTAGSFLSVICHDMDGTRDRYVKQDELGSQRQAAREPCSHEQSVMGVRLSLGDGVHEVCQIQREKANKDGCAQWV